MRGSPAVGQWKVRRWLLLEAITLRERMGLPATRTLPWSRLDAADLWCNWGPRWRHQRSRIKMVKRLLDIEQRYAPQWWCYVADLLPVDPAKPPGNEKLTAPQAVHLASLLPDLVDRVTLEEAIAALHWDADLFLIRGSRHGA